MANFGIKTSQSTFDVEETADFNLLMSSAFPLLKVAKIGHTTISGTANSVVYNHGLGYEPMFLIFDSSGTPVSGKNAFKSYGVVYNGSAGGYLAVNSTNLQFFTLGVGSGDVSFTYVVFRQKLTENFRSTKLSGNSRQTLVDNDFGIKVAKEGKSVDSDDLRDYALHSNTRSPLINSVVHGSLSTATAHAVAGATGLVDQHDLGYTPLAYFYINYGANDSATYDTGYYYMLGGVGGVADIRAYITAQKCVVEDDVVSRGVPSTATASIITLKDPFEKQLTSVVY